MKWLDRQVANGIDRLIRAWFGPAPDLSASPEASSQREAPRSARVKTYRGRTQGSLSASAVKNGISLTPAESIRKAAAEAGWKVTPDGKGRWRLDPPKTNKRD